MKNFVRRHCLPLAAALLLLIGASNALAQSSAFPQICRSVAPGGSWTNPATWSDCALGNGTVSGTPGPIDTAIITAGTTVTVSGTPAPVDRIEVDGTLDLGSGSTLSVGAGFGSSAAFLFASPTTGAATLKGAGTLTWSSPLGSPLNLSLFGGTVEGTPTLRFGSLSVFGTTFRPGGAGVIGNITVDGSLSFSGVLEADLGPTTNDRIIVTGPLPTTNGTVRVIQNAGYTPPLGSERTVISSSALSGSAVVNQIIRERSGVPPFAMVGLGAPSVFTAVGIRFVRHELKAEFVPNRIAAGNTSILTLTLTNAAVGADPITVVEIGVDSDIDLVSASGGTCGVVGPMISLLMIGKLFEFTGGTIPSEGSCTITVAVTSKTRTSDNPFYARNGFLETAATGVNGIPQLADAALFVDSPRLGLQLGVPTSVTGGPLSEGTTVLTATINLTSPSTTIGAGSVTLPPGMVVDPLPGAPSGCGLSLTVSGSVVSWLAGTTSVGFCQITIPVKFSRAVSRVLEPFGSIADGSLTPAAVLEAPLTILGMTAVFNPSPIAPTATSKLTVTLSNPSSRLIRPLETIIRLPPLTIWTMPAAPCFAVGQLVTSDVSNARAQFERLSIPAASSATTPGTCTFDLTAVSRGPSATAPTLVALGGIDFNSGEVSAGNLAALTISTTPAMTASFSPAAVPTSTISNSVLTVTFTNPTAAALTSLSATVSLPPNLNATHSASIPTNNTCGGTITPAGALATGFQFAITGGVVPVGACALKFDVNSAAAAEFPPVTGGGTSSGIPPPTSFTFVPQNTLQVVGMTATFAASSITTAQTTTMTVRFTKPPSVLPFTVSGAAIDLFPLGAVVPTSNTCGTTITNPDSGVFEFSTFTISANAAGCDIVFTGVGSTTASPALGYPVFGEINLGAGPISAGTLGSLVVTGVASSPTVSPTPATFVSAIGGSTDQTFTLSGGSAGIPTLSFVSNNTQYAVLAGGATPCGTSLAANATCTFVVRHAPTQIAATTGTISINDGISPSAVLLVSVGVTGTGTAPTVAVALAAHSATVVLTTSTVIGIITNTSTVPITILSVVRQAGDSTFVPTLTGSTTPCSTTPTLAPAPATGSSCTFTSTFSPTSVPATNPLTASYTVAISAGTVAPATFTATASIAATGSVVKADQIITFGTNPGPVTFSPAGTFTVSATGGASGNAVTFSSLTTLVCTVALNSATVNIVSAGTCTIAANQVGDVNYNPAPQVTQAITIGQATQSITFAALASRPLVPATFVVSATGGASGNAVTFSTTTPTICSASGTNGTTVNLLAAGACAVRASQAGNANYQPATAVDQTFTVGTNPTLTATFSSSPVINAVTNLTLTLGNPQTVPATISAGTINLPPGVTRNGAITSTASCAITLSEVAGVVTFNAGTIAATSSCDIVVPVQSANVGAYPLNIAASQLQTSIGNNANVQAVTLTVNKAPQAISFSPLPPTTATFGAGPITLSAAGGASLNAVTFTTTTTSTGCTVTVAGIVTIAGVGTCVIAANQAGNANYLAAEEVLTSITIAPFQITSAVPVLTSGTATSHTFTANGSETKTWSIATGSTLPTGLTLNSATGALSGTPTNTTAQTFTVQVSSGAATATQTVTIAATATVPGLTLTLAGTAVPNPLDFGLVPINTSSVAREVLLTNDGTGPLNITTLTPAPGSNPFSYTLGTAANPCANPLASTPGANTCVLSIRFNPLLQVLNQQNSITISSDAPGLPRVVNLQGSGGLPTSPVLTVTGRLDFNGQTINTTGAPRFVRVENTGTANLTISQINLNAPGFIRVAVPAPDVGCAVGTTLAPPPSAPCFIGVASAPTTLGFLTGTLEIATTTGQAASVSVSGGGTPVPEPVIALAPALNFGNLIVNTTSAPQSFMISNVGNAPLFLSQPTIIGVNQADFTLTGPPCTVLVAGFSCAFDVTFRPGAVGARSAQVSVATNAANAGAVNTLNLNGVGLPVPAPVASTSATAIGFGNNIISGAALLQTFTLTNTGTAPMLVASIGVNLSDYVVSHTCPAVLNVNQSCAITIAFSPIGIGARPALVSIITNATPNEANVSLSGTGCRWFTQAGTRLFTTLCGN